MYYKGERIVKKATATAAIALFMAIGFVLSACSGTRPNAEAETAASYTSATMSSTENRNTGLAEYRNISPEEAKALIDGGNVIILDVRIKEEYDGGHIKDAILLPDTDIVEQAETVLPDKTAKILVYCRSGRRSASAAKELIAMGYTNVLDFGGIIDWPYQIVG